MTIDQTIAGQPATRPQGAWLRHGGELGGLIRQRSWDATPLGPLDGWPAGLKAALNLILPAQAQIVLFWGPDLLAFYNDAYAATIGQKHPAALGAPAAHIWAEMWDDLGPLLREVMESGNTVSAKDRPFQFNRHGFLEEVHYDISYSPVPDADGQVCGVLCIVNETTDRVQLTRRLSESEARLRVASERIELALNAGAVLGTWVWDVQVDRFTADDRFARTFGIDAAALARGLPIDEVKQSIHPEDMERVNRKLAAAMRAGGRYSAEYRVSNREGGWRWIEANGHVELDPDGRPVRFPGVLVDIDRRRAAEVTMRRSEARFRALAQALPNQVWTARADGGVDWVNQRALEYTGLGIGKLLEDGWTRPVHPEDLPDMLHAWRTAVETRGDFSAELRMRRHDGAWRWHLARAVCTGDAEDARWVGTLTDIDDQKASQASLARINALLEQRVRQRSQELEEALQRLEGNAPAASA